MTTAEKSGNRSAVAWRAAEASGCIGGGHWALVKVELQKTWALEVIWRGGGEARRNKNGETTNSVAKEEEKPVGGARTSVPSPFQNVKEKGINIKVLKSQ
jgi:hypothetical protein